MPKICSLELRCTVGSRTNWRLSSGRWRKLSGKQSCFLCLSALVWSWSRTSGKLRSTNANPSFRTSPAWAEQRCNPPWRWHSSKRSWRLSWEEPSWVQQALHKNCRKLACCKLPVEVCKMKMIRKKDLCQPLLYPTRWVSTRLSWTSRLA